MGQLLLEEYLGRYWLNFSRSCGSAVLAVRTPCVFLRSASNKHAVSMAGERLLSRGGDVEKSYVARACDARLPCVRRTARKKRRLSAAEEVQDRIPLRRPCVLSTSSTVRTDDARRTHGERTEWPKTLDFFVRRLSVRLLRNL